MQKFPQGLKELKQWAVAGANKIPYNPVTGKPAKPNDPTTWVSFNEAYSKVVSGEYENVGFMLSKDDPYTVIDLDDPKPEKYTEEQKAVLIRNMERIVNKFDSYTELSRSGKGCHIIVRASTEAGRKKDTVEIYSSERFIICTGNVVKDRAVEEYQDLVDFVYEMIAPSSQSGTLIDFDKVYEYSEDEQYSDNWLINKLLEDKDHLKFQYLCAGDHASLEKLGHKYLGDDSLLDMALIDMLGRYSQNYEQIERLFLRTPLGSRTKHLKNPKKLKYTLRKYFSNKVAMEAEQRERREAVNSVDISKIQKQAQEIINKEIEPKSNVPWPPGFMGKIAEAVYHGARYQSAAIAVGSALGLVAGIAGRNYRIGSQGLNLYIALLASSGTGKESGKSGVRNILRAIESEFPQFSVEDLVMGNNQEPKSAPALAKMLGANPCFVSVFDEVGYLMGAMAGSRAPQYLVDLSGMMLKLYTANGKNGRLSGNAYSDKEKNMPSVMSPSFTILGESTQLKFFDKLTPNDIESGLLPRFTIFEHIGERSKVNRNCDDYVVPVDVKKQVETLMHVRMNKQMQAKPAVGQDIISPSTTIETIPISESAEMKQIKFDYEDNVITPRMKEDKVVGPLWARTPQMAERIAGLCAVIDNPDNPVLTKEYWDWGLTVAEHSIGKIIAHLESGEMATVDDFIEAKLVDILCKFTAKHGGFTSGKNANSFTPQMKRDGVVAVGDIADKLKRSGSKFTAAIDGSRFKGNIIGFTQWKLEQMEESGSVVILDKETAAKYKHGARGRTPTMVKWLGGR